MDITETLAPRSDQQNYDDVSAAPRTFTVADVTPGNAEQPVHVHLAEAPERPYKPNKSMRRVIAKGWGTETQSWIGRRLTLYGDPDVKWGGKAVGGIRVAAMSHLDKPFTLALTVTRGKRETAKVEALPDDAPTTEPHPDWNALITEAGDDVEALRAMWQDASARGASQGVLNAIKTAATNATNTKEN